MKRTNSIITVLAVLIALFAVNFLASRHPLRIDLTDKKVYTLAKSTKDTLGKLDDVITIRVYFTNDLPPALVPLRRDVEDILGEFKGFAKNRLKIEFVDPGESRIDEQKLAMMGIPPVQLNVIERDKQEVAKIYLGMAVMFGDKQEIIPVVQNIDNLEYDLLQAIIKVSSKEQPKIAWWAPKEDDAKPGQGFKFIRELAAARYSVIDVTDKNLSELDPEKLSAVVLISPRLLSAGEVFALDQYIMKGGKLIALIDVAEVTPSLQMTPVESNATKILLNYGITIENSLVLDAAAAMAAFSGGAVTYHIPYPYWPQLSRDQFNRKNPIVANLESVVLPWTSPLFLTSEEVLAVSSNLSSAIPIADVKLDPQSAGASLNIGRHESRPLIALVNGPFKSYLFAGEAKPPKEGSAIAEGKEDARIFVVGSSHWVSDKVLQTFQQNAVLFENALDSMAMGDVLIGVRSRETLSRPIANLSDGLRAGLKYANIAFGPVALAIIGVIVFLARRARRRASKFKFS